MTAGHPDKLCDQISDAAVDAYLALDAQARITVECAIATGVVFIAARFAADGLVDLPSLARVVLAEAGYVGSSFDAQSCSILTALTDLDKDHRVPEIRDDEELFERWVAQEQVNVFGFAIRETPELMPLPIMLAHRLARRLDAVRADGIAWLAPDGKTQASVAYKDHKPQHVMGITVTAAIEADGPSGRALEEAVRSLVVEPALGEAGWGIDPQTEIHVNPGGPYLIGGPSRHAGLTGRKTGIDTYGEFARQSGAALSGKDPWRIDRIGAYAARHAAKTVVAAGLADRCEVHLSFAIGRARPISVAVDTFGTGKRAEMKIAEDLSRLFDFRPAAIAARYGLFARPSVAGPRGFFRRLAVYGQIGRTDLDLPWEATDLADALRA